MLASWRSMIKIAGSGSISQRHGSADPDPPQNVMDPQHWFFGYFSSAESFPSQVRAGSHQRRANTNPHWDSVQARSRSQRLNSRWKFCFSRGLSLEPFACRWERKIFQLRCWASKEVRDGWNSFFEVFSVSSKSFEKEQKWEKLSFRFWSLNPDPSLTNYTVCTDLGPAPNPSINNQKY